MFDLARPETFDSALSWLADVTEKLFDERQQQQQQQQRQQQVSSAPATGGARARAPPQHSVSTVETTTEPDPGDLMPVVLLANKCDLPDLKIPRNKYSTYVRENGLLSWYETSSRDPSCGVALAVRRLVEFVMETDPTLKVARENASIWKKKQ